jgi:DNA-binding HxlR family transcriptional regulator
MIGSAPIAAGGAIRHVKVAAASAIRTLTAARLAKVRNFGRSPMLQFVKHCAKLGLVVASSDVTCPVCATAEIICGKWTILVIRDLAEGRSRFCELERSLSGISPRTLSLRLKALEDEGIVARDTYPEVPPRVEYSLTDKGRALLPLIDDMRRYGREWLGGECGADAVAVASPEPATAVA